MTQIVKIGHFMYVRRC